MGTTDNLALTYPEESDTVDPATDIKTLAQDIDDLVTIQTWTPAYDNITEGTSPTTVADYFTLPTGLVVAFWSLALGTSPAVAAGPLVTLPVNCHANIVAGDPIGTVIFYDKSATKAYHGLLLRSSSSAGKGELAWFGSTGAQTALSSTVPFTWAATDRLSFNATYRPVAS